MATITWLVKVEQGIDYEQSWRWNTQDNETAVVTPKDLTDYTAYCQIRSGPNGYLLQDNVPVELGGITGIVTLRIPAEMSWTWDWEMAKYDIVIYDPDGRPIDRWAEGMVVVSPGTTVLPG